MREAGLRITDQVIDPLVDDPPTDVAGVRYRARRPLRAILVPVAGGRNSGLAIPGSAVALHASSAGGCGSCRRITR